jgi:hypothetical protein
MTNSGTTFPYVCKYYNATCPLLEQDEKFKEYPVSFYTKKAGKYSEDQVTLESIHMFLDIDDKLQGPCVESLIY